MFVNLLKFFMMFYNQEGLFIGILAGGGVVSQKMTQKDRGDVGGLGKDDKDKGWGQQQENYVNWKLEPGPNF